MRIASEICKEGISTSNAFNKAVQDVIYKMHPLKIVETGTYNGEGSSSAIAEAMPNKGKLITIESSKELCRQARKVLDTFRKEIVLLNGVTIPCSDIPLTVSYEGYPDDIIVDHLDPNEYLYETSAATEYDCLGKALLMFHFKPDMVLLDSAGHLGWIEFNYLMNLVQGDFILCLDDTNHFKHYRTAEHIRSNPEWEILFETDDKFGSMIAKYKFE